MPEPNMNIALKHLLKPLNKAETAIDRWLFARRVRKGKLGDIIVYPYRGFGNEQEINIVGRVLEHNGLVKPSPEDSTWTNIKAMARRYMSREIPYVYIQAHFQGGKKIVRANDEGYFHLQMPYTEAVDPQQLWHGIQFHLIDRLARNYEPITARGEVLIPDERSEYGIISDIDDTVLISKTTHRIEIFRMALVNNATTRNTFQGVARLYQALQQGSDGECHNPFFYVSSSPWNMYDMLDDFMRINHLPVGPILLRDIGLAENRFIKGKHSKHKLSKIRQIMRYNADLPFILIGDSGQRDPEIYQQVSHEFPGRVKAVYIRDITSEKRKAEVKKIARQMNKKGIPFILKAHTHEAVEHAEQAGLIVKGSSKKVKAVGQYAQ